MTNETKHTPKPWRVRGADFNPSWLLNYSHSVQIFSGTRILAVVQTFAGNPELAEKNDHTEGEANSKLMCAAPDLLEACKAALRDASSKEEIHPRSRITLSMATCQLLREAIAKAEKGQS